MDAQWQKDLADAQENAAEALRFVAYGLSDPTNPKEPTVAEALDRVARALIKLGNADASTSMGGLEALGAVLEAGFNRLASAVGDHAEAVERLADALEKRA